MTYLYYPGCCCALKATGRAYEESTEAVFGVLGVTYREVEDWNCCGATMYMAVDETRSWGLSLRNLALAEAQAGNGGADLLTPCPACYVVMRKAQQAYAAGGRLAEALEGALSDAGLSYHGTVRVRHPLDVLVNDVGLARVRQAVRRPLTGLRVVCYYGCLLTRPFATFDDPANPTSLDRLVETLGAEPVDWPLKTRCCGGSLTGTVEEVGLRLSYLLLKEAQRRGADVVVTACPFCECNLECFQRKVQAAYPDLASIPAVFFTQLVGVALGLQRKQLGLQRMLVPLEPTLERRLGGVYA
ncbi:MAG: CoB--CoM heterodisulfide reductase iron-sulfur subunit B family protein [Thermoanaerobaculum sp.]|nr:CoB--CoM heterodisulfide reductase iron-sulfur subunit B family protein [Thermoanaerobaculum sp.]MDW7967666.1 CoB--CoM heterodisulfide reductase iron-sulfur subunit B family protein [Thermoanaerobaculum sp.]